MHRVIVSRKSIVFHYEHQLSYPKIQIDNYKCQLISAECPKSLQIDLVTQKPTILVIYKTFFYKMHWFSIILKKVS